MRIVDRDFILDILAEDAERELKNETPGTNIYLVVQYQARAIRAVRDLSEGNFTEALRRLREKM